MYRNELEKIARVCHEANRAICETFQDHSQKSWLEAPEWQRESCVNGVQFTLENPDAPPSASHDNWLKHKSAEGWRYGPTKDAEKKEHPCMVPYEYLPPHQRVKDAVFQSIVRAMTRADVNLPHKDKQRLTLQADIDGPVQPR